MGKEIKIHYYEEGDELNILIGQPKECRYVEIDDEIYVRVDPVTKEVQGFTITNFTARNRKGEEIIPLLGHFSLPEEIEDKVFASG